LSTARRAARAPHRSNAPATPAGAGLRDRIRTGASGKIVTGTDLVKRLIQGAGHGNAAHAMTFAVGCIQAQHCHTDACPAGVTQEPRRACTLDVGDKYTRMHRLQEATAAAHCRSWHP
jgi:glutamate synthase domain-containing protein 2